MPFTAQTRGYKKRSKPFLILPLIEHDFSAKAQEIVPRMPVKNPGLNLFIKTWPPKMKNKKPKDQEENRRPLTATLEKPMVLDVRLAKKIDMSKIRKEFLNITNLCRIPLILKSKSKKGCRPVSLPPPSKKKDKNMKMTDPEDSWEDEESVSTRSTSRIQSIKADAVLTPIKKKPVITSIAHTSSIKSCDANNNTKPTKLCGTYRVTRKQRQQRQPLPINVKLSASSVKSESTTAKFELNAKSESISNLNVTNKSTKHGQVTGSNVEKKTIIAIVPEPCKTCCRRNQPERLHSHPATPIRDSTAVIVPKKMEVVPKIPVKITVQKPVAIKYKSKTKNENNNCPTYRKTPTSTKTMPPTILPESRKSPNSPPEKVTPNRIRSAKRTLTCYLCGREFGSASLHIHEPKCLQRWERENASLPPHLQRSPPPRPDSAVSQDEWNKSAWEASQASLVPCRNCGRTFYPDRLIVHQRSCKTPQHNIKNQTSDYNSMSSSLSAPMTDSTPSTPSSSGRPPTVECYICGKLFGTKSIKIHEKQCLKKWNVENDSLPRDIRSPPPTRSEQPKSPDPQQNSQTPSVNQQREKDDRPSSRKAPLFPCYLCGKLFTVNSIYIHEPQCLKMWKIENDKLPPHKRRPQPMKPDIKFTRDGKVDHTATAEEMWQTHLRQLVPCRMCSRTFNPDRVEVHERSCKGL